MQEVYIIAALRTPLGSFGGVLTDLSATDLGAAAMKGALAAAGVTPEQIDEVFFGNVCSANLGQAPARQAALKAGLPNSVPCTTINKVCSSGIKAVMLGAQAIMAGQQDIVLAGGMESMSNIPYYVPQARWGAKYGHVSMIDGLAKDGLTDAYDGQAMGVCADATAAKYGISRAAQDEYAISSYQRAAQATTEGWFAQEIVPVAIPQRKGDPLMVTEDEEFKRVKFDKIPTLRAAFTKDGTVTAANASTINDGAAAIILASKQKVEELGLKPLARIVAFADAAQEPQWFTTAPTIAAPLALKKAGMTMADIDFFEVNEAFAVVSMAFGQVLHVDRDKMNVFGGAVAIGHPLGASGARILTTLNNVLTQKQGTVGMAAICNGGGGASAMIIEKV
ncbi:MAG: acetyl-CoA C-acyltransferase [Bacteroidetes bacterium]|nr:MAG: acetyl-CoA C-acyltransferase [Bacteroidota bacterium]